MGVTDIARVSHYLHRRLLENEATSFAMCHTSYILRRCFGWTPLLLPAGFRLGNGCYLFSSHITSWQNAHFACRDAQAQLAVFETRWEDSTIGTYLSRPEFAPLER